MATVVPAIVVVVPEIDQLNQIIEWVGFPIGNERLFLEATLWLEDRYNPLVDHHRSKSTDTSPDDVN